jgi:hypothetical protein
MSTSNSQNAENLTASTEYVEITTTKNNEIPVSSETEFTRAAVEGLGNRVRVTDYDEDSGLELLCYVHCGPDDDSLICQCRGVVFHENDIVMRAFPYTIEYSHNNVEKIKQNIESNFGNCVCYDAHEGALVRMFNFSNRWYISTHRKLNAFRSKWSSNESFGASFERALEFEIENNPKLRDAMPKNDGNLLERFQTILDPTKQYMFLVRHNEDNRIVCAVPKHPTLYHVGTFVEGELVMTEDVHIPYPRKHSFSNTNELTDYVNKIDIHDLQGVIVFAPGNRQYKILHRDYIDLFRARGNVPSVKFRYLEVRMNPTMSAMLYHLYPNMTETFDEYENSLYAIAKTIYRSYVQRHIKGKWSTLPNQEYKVDRECHSWHEEDRKMNIVTLDKVVEILNRQPPTNLNAMIRRYNSEKKRQQETQDNVITRNRSATISSPSDSPSPSVLSPLLLSKNNQKNLTIPSHDLGPSALTVMNENKLIA